MVVCLRLIARGVNGMEARKRIMRLTGWQRLGIVLSVVWALSAGIYTRNADVERADNFAKFAYKVCSDSKSLAHDTDLSSCAHEREEHLETWMKGRRC